MQNVLLIVELLLALALIGIVLLQRSEGAGGLGMSGGNMSGRSPQSALGRATWYLGIAFFACALALTVVEAKNSGAASVLDRMVDSPASAPESSPAGLPGGADLLPPKTDLLPVTPATDTPVAPVTETPATDAPATDAPATDAPATDAPATDAPASN